ncbi:MAG: hypothetical protein JRG94_20760 [Deltaproteobacteria bacterium]|nr:hypothetical protein [Deltaproteobacteria bacterium]
MISGCLACTSPAPLIEHKILLPLMPRAALQPSESDLATRDLARAALLTDREGMDRSLAKLRELAENESEPDRDLDRRIPMSMDLRNSTIDDPVVYRKACRSLKGRKDNDPRLESRLEECMDDDYLRLAQRRVNDSREAFWAETYNAVADPLSRSIISGGILTPYYIANSAATYLARINERDSFSVQLRQALTHRERYLSHFPNSEEAPRVQRRVDKARRKLRNQESKKLVFQSKVAFDNGNLRISQVLARRARDTNPENKAAAKAAERAALAIEAQRTGRIRSQGVAFDRVSLEDATRATGLLLAGHDLAGEGVSLMRSEDYEDVGQYTIATALAERGHESASWDRLHDLGARNPIDSTAARHARGLVLDPAQNPYGSFKRVESIQRGKKIRWHFFGPFFQGPRYKRTPRPISWLLDLPLLLNTISCSIFPCCSTRSSSPRSASSSRRSARSPISRSRWRSRRTAISIASPRESTRTHSHAGSTTTNRAVTTGLAHFAWPTTCRTSTPKSARNSSKKPPSNRSRPRAGVSDETARAQRCVTRRESFPTPRRGTVPGSRHASSAKPPPPRTSA